MVLYNEEINELQDVVDYLNDTWDVESNISFKLTITPNGTYYIYPEFEEEE